MKIPVHLKHKPVIVSEAYDTIGGRKSVRAAAKGLSLGIAALLFLLLISGTMLIAASVRLQNVTDGLAVLDKKLLDTLAANASADAYKADAYKADFMTDSTDDPGSDASSAAGSGEQEVLIGTVDSARLDYLEGQILQLASAQEALEAEGLKAVASLKEQLAAQQEQLTAQQEQLEIRQNELDTLHGGLKALQDRLEASARKYDTLINDLYDQNETLKGDIAAVARQNAALQAEIEKMKAQNLTVSQDLEKLRRAVLTFHNMGLFGTIRTINREGILRILDLKEEKPYMTQEEAAEILKREGFTISTYEIFLIYGAYFNEFK